MIIKIPGRGAVTIYSDTNTYISIPGDGPAEVITAGGPLGNGLLMETGDYLMLETGDYILLEA